MRIQKIAKFEKHDKGSYSVWYENTVNQRVIMPKAEFDLAQCIDEFIRRGIDPKDIRRILDLANNVIVSDMLDDNGNVFTSKSTINFWG